MKVDDVHVKILQNLYITVQKRVLIFFRVYKGFSNVLQNESLSIENINVDFTHHNVLNLTPVDRLTLTS